MNSEYNIISTMSEQMVESSMTKFSYKGRVQKKKPPEFETFVKRGGEVRILFKQKFYKKL